MGFGVDWDGDGKVSEKDKLMTMAILDDEMEEENRRKTDGNGGSGGSGGGCLTCLVLMVMVPAVLVKLLLLR